MKRPSSMILVLVLLGCVAGSLCLQADDQETQIALADCPKAVRKTLKKESKRGKIEEVEFEKEDGKTIYEAEVILNGKEYEVEVAEDGTLLSKVFEDEGEESEDSDDNDGNDEEKEVEIKLSDCPKPVQLTFEREAHGGKIEEVTKEQEGKRTVFEAEIEIDGKDYEVEVAEDGTLLSKVLEDEEWNDKDDDDKDD